MNINDSRNHFLTLEKKLGELLSLSKCTEHDQEKISEFIEATEYGLAFDELCGALSDSEEHITKEQFSIIRRLSDLMGVPIPCMNQLMKKIQE